MTRAKTVGGTMRRILRTMRGTQARAMHKPTVPFLSATLRLSKMLVRLTTAAAMR
jgi:hypothetical protein